MQITLAIAFAIFSVIGFANESRAAFSYATPDSIYSQNFDSLPTAPRDATLGNSPIGWTNDNAAPGAGNFSIVGWYLFHPLALTEGGFDSHQRMRVGGGAANTGAFMSYGDTPVLPGVPSTDRALGSLASNTLANAGSNQFMGLRLTNSTGSKLISVTLAYFGEQWRDGGATVPNAQSLTFGYKLTASGAGPLLQDGGFTAVPTLDFTSPVFANLGTGAAVNGNTVGRVGVGPVTISGLQWLNGTDLWIRWADLNNSGNDHGLAIDDLSFRASTPEPASALVWGCIALIGVAGLRYLR